MRYGVIWITAIPEVPPSIAAVIVMGPTYAVVPRLNVVVDEPPVASPMRLKVPIDAPVAVVAVYVAISGELTVPSVRTSVTRMVVLPPVWSVEASGATNTRSGYAAVNCADVSAMTASTVAVTRAWPTVVLVIVAPCRVAAVRLDRGWRHGAERPLA